LLAVLAYFVMNQKGETDTAESLSISETDTLETIINNDEQTDDDSAIPVVKGDTIIDADTSAVQTSAVEIHIQMKDTSWLQVVADEISVRDGVFRRSSDKITITANDSIIVRVARPSAVEITFNGQIVPGSGTAPRNWRFKKDDVRTMSIAEWERAPKRTRQ